MWFVFVFTSCANPDYPSLWIVSVLEDTFILTEAMKEFGMEFRMRL